MGRVPASNGRCYPALYSISTCFCSHSPILSSQEPKKQPGQEDWPSAHKLPAQMPCEGPGLELCDCSTFCRWGHWGPEWGYDQSQFTEPEGGPWGSPWLSTHPGGRPPASATRYPDALQPRRQTSGVTCSHIFQAGLFPGRVSPPERAPRPFPTVRRTREEMTKILL